MSKDLMIKQLEEQLRITNEQLQSTIERMETANEELVTVNAELQSKVDELGLTNSDLQNFLASTDIATIFLDRQFRVKRFSPAMAKLFNLLTADIGRPLQHFSGIINYPALHEDAESVLQTLAPVEREVSDPQGQSYYMVRVLPYRTMEDVIDGVVVTFFNITSRKRTENSLQRERRLLAGIMQSTDVMLVYLDTEFNFVSVNQAYARTCQLTPEELVGKNHFTLYPDAENEAIFRMVRDTGEPVFYKDKPFTFPDQPERGVTYWDWSLVPVRGADEEVAGLVFSLRETTEYKLMELALRESEEKYRSLFANLLDGFCYCRMIFDDQGEPVDYVFLEANSAFEAMSGFKDVIGKRVTEVIPGVREAHPEMFAAYGRVARSGKPEKFVIHFTPTGRWFEVSAYSTEKGYVAIIFDNITERKLAEEAKEKDVEMERARLEELEAILEAVPAAVLISHDAQCRVITGNRAAYELLRMPRGRNTLKGGFDSPSHFRVFHDGRELPPDELPVQRAAGRGELIRDFEEEILFADGDRVSVFGNSVPLRDRDGKPAGAVAAFVDVTPLARAEKELLARTMELQRSNEDLEQFAHVASHDLQEPLRVVTSFLGLLRKRYEPKLDDKALEYIGYAVDGATRMSQLVCDLLEYSRVGSRGHELVRTDSGKALAVALANLAGSIEKICATVTHDKLPVIMGDQTQLLQLFQNLIGNALKFRSPDSPCKIHVGVRKEEGQWTFSVQDNGIGIDSAYFDRIFVIFQRLHTHDKYPGTGMGLTICKKIVERHGGRIWVESKAGEGTTFFFTLPEVHN